MYANTCLKERSPQPAEIGLLDMLGASRTSCCGQLAHKKARKKGTTEHNCAPLREPQQAEQTLINGGNARTHQYTCKSTHTQTDEKCRDTKNMRLHVEQYYPQTAALRAAVCAPIVLYSNECKKLLRVGGTVSVAFFCKSYPQSTLRPRPFAEEPLCVDLKIGADGPPACTFVHSFSAKSANSTETTLKNRWKKRMQRCTET
jgi:hypothetical protein